MTSVDVCDAVAVVARRLAQCIMQGSTLWAVAPGLEDHAQHLAVEFVHPASVGAMAVPAIAVAGEWETVISTLRERTRSGDVVISMGPTGSATLAALSLRTAAWGTDHVHIGWRATTANAPLDPRTFVVTLGTDDSAERLLTRTYHLLWELTFICLQNNRLTKRTIPPTANAPSCAVCADEATTTEIVEVFADNRASVRTACGTEVVDTSLIDTVHPNDLLLVHAGIALRRLELPCH